MFNRVMAMAASTLAVASPMISSHKGIKLYQFDPKDPDRSRIRPNRSVKQAKPAKRSNMRHVSKRVRNKHRRAA